MGESISGRENSQACRQERAHYDQGEKEAYVATATVVEREKLGDYGWRGRLLNALPAS